MCILGPKPLRRLFFFFSNKSRTYKAGSIKLLFHLSPGYFYLACEILFAECKIVIIIMRPRCLKEEQFLHKLRKPRARYLNIKHRAKCNTHACVYNNGGSKSNLATSVNPSRNRKRARGCVKLDFFPPRVTQPPLFTSGQEPHQKKRAMQI